MPSLVRSLPLTLFAALALCATALAPRAAALVVVVADGEVHTAPPPDDPGWNYVGDRGVYVGNRWILTAAHVTPGPMTFSNGSVFQIEGAAVPIHNPAGSGLTADADLVMYRLTTDPGLPALPISAATPALGAKVTLIGSGQGVDDGAAETQWDRSGDSPDYTYTPVDSDGDFHGYASTSSTLRWGTNLVANEEPLRPEGDDDHTIAVNSGRGDTVSFVTKFDDAPLSLVTDSESQAQSGDSGSGAFLKVGGVWTLVGITHAVEAEEDQPAGGTGTAFYGNYTYIADLAYYRDQILAISAVPELGSLTLVGAASVLAACGLARRRLRTP